MSPSRAQNFEMASNPSTPDMCSDFGHRVSYTYSNLEERNPRRSVLGLSQFLMKVPYFTREVNVNFRTRPYTQVNKMNQKK